MKAEPNMETEVRSTLDQLWELHKKGDSEELIKIFSADPDVTFIGTRSDSKQIGIENIRTHFKQTFDRTAKLTELNFENILVSGTGSIAWVSTDLDIQITTPDETMKVFARLTAVLQNQDNMWKIAQLHFSMPTAFTE